MIQKLIFTVSLIALLFSIYSCNSDEPTRFTEIRLVPIEKIDSIITTQTQIIVKATYTTPDPCWTFYKSEIINNDTTIILKVYAKYEGQNCPQVVSSITHIDTIYLSSAGFKKLRFWQNDSLYKDTTVVFASNYNITFPDFFVERGSDTDSSYISFRGRKIHPYLFEVEGTGWGIIETGILLEKISQPQKLFFQLMGECGTVLTQTWNKTSRTQIITADILDTVNTLAFTNLFRNTDTINVSR